MEVRYPRCAGLDVHKKTVVAALRIADGRSVRTAVRQFATTTTALGALLDWLVAEEVTHVALEATGVYWKPVWHVLEDAVELVLVNAAHVRQVPGRKSDLTDAQWLAELLAHGLLRGSFVPPAPVQELRDLTRTRKQLGRELTQHNLRIQRVLEDANLKLGSVISEVLGVSGRAILDALVAGEADPERLATAAKGRLKCAPEELVEALRGRATAHHRFLIGQHLQMVDSLQARIAAFDEEIQRRLEPFPPAVERLTAIPGVSEVAAQAIVAELGVDMARFPTVGQLRSWAGLCPRLDESAGKRRSTRIRKGAPWLKAMLVQCAKAAARAKGTYLQAQYQRLKSRRGGKKAAVAVAASILTAVYYMLRDDVAYRDLGADHFTRRDKVKIAHRLARRIQALGYEVAIQPLVA
jgi:transposase